jgi:peptidoglycan/LPS O-acetylase OafA/YrhL
MKAEGYRSDIDGLRAVAVVSVLLFHLDFALLAGGFVGVDVFFVISGYLITGILANEVERTGRIDFARFYMRRVRRLLPSMLATVAVSTLAAGVLFAPNDLRDFGGSAIFAIIPASNIYFWANVSYFDTEAIYKPLLHTWSLSVEEQFYLVWPLLLVLSWRGGRAFTGFVLLAVAATSLVLNLLAADGLPSLPMVGDWFADGRSTIYYLLPFRAFELAIGGLLVWVPGRFRPHGAAADAAVAAGLAMIVYSMLTYGEEMVFPSYNALLPCIGTAAAIFGGAGSRIAPWTLGARPIAWFGRSLGYTLYLAHWPVIVFYRYSTGADLAPLEQALLAAVAVAAGYGLHRFVEIRYRYAPAPGTRGLRGAAFGLSCATLALVLALSGASAWATGWYWRFSPDVARQLAASRRQNDKFVWRRMKQLQKDFAKNDKTKVLLIGDSMAADLVNIFAETGDLDTVDLRTKIFWTRCQPIFPKDAAFHARAVPSAAAGCRRDLKEAVRDKRFGKAGLVIVAARWRRWSLAAVPDTIAFLRSRGVKRIAIVGTKSQSVDGQQYLAVNAWRGRYPPVPIMGETAEINASLREIAATHGVDFLDPTELFCSTAGCRIVLDDGRLVMFDRSHVTAQGAKVLGREAGKLWAPRLFADTAAGTLAGR